MNKFRSFINSNRTFSAFVICLIFLSSCSEVDVNFQVNGRSALQGDETSEDLQNPDTSNTLKVFVGDTVIFRNTTEPEENISSQKWDVDGDELIDEEFTGVPVFKTVYSRPDRFMAALWVNDAEVPARMWIEVQGDFQVFDEIVPEINFVSPSSSKVDSETDDFEFKASLTEIYSSDSIVLSVNGEEVDFFYDEMTGILEQSIRLEDGDNDVTLMAYVDGSGTFTESAVITYEAEPVIKKTAYRPPPPPPTKKKPKPEAKSKPVDDNLSDVAKAGYDMRGIDENCRNQLVEDYSFTITPSKKIKITDFVIFNTVCGALKVTISSSEGELLTTSETLTEGKSQISFGLYTDEVFLKKDVQYTFQLTPLQGNENCGRNERPKLIDTKACSPKLRKRSHLSADFRGKSIIHDITYYY